jgi:signal transduction histidine kinase
MDILDNSFLVVHVVPKVVPMKKRQLLLKLLNFFVLFIETSKENCMKHLKMMSLASLALVASFSTASFAEDAATAEEVIGKVQAAATAASAAIKGKEGAAADEALVAEFGKADWKWKDTYVFVLSCTEEGKADKMIAHPTLAGKSLADKKDKGPDGGKPFFDDMCAAGKKQPKGGWISYQWNKPKEETASRKISYVLEVEGSSYEVSAGIYNEDATVDSLDALLK